MKQQPKSCMFISFILSIRAHRETLHPDWDFTNHWGRNKMKKIKGTAERGPGMTLHSNKHQI